MSPFLKASIEGNKDTAAAPVAEKKPAAPKQAAAPSLDVSSAAPAVPAGQPEKPGTISDPAWLILVAGGITMLYLYLRENRKKRRHK